MLLAKHENETFQNETVYISGQAFIRCTFVACTLVLRETIHHMQECTFDRCNWHVDTVLLWGVPESLQQIKAVVNLIEQGQQQMQAAERQQDPNSMDPSQGQGPQDAPQGTPGGPGNRSPFA